MASDVTQREALTHLGASTAEAVARVLDMFVPGGVERGEVTVTGDGQNPFVNLPTGGVAASVRYIDGVTGANVLLMPAACARGLAEAMGAGEQQDGPLTELEMSAVGEASNQMLASAAAAISVVIGQEIDISPPDVRIIAPDIDSADVWGTAPHACSTSFTIAGQPCRLVQLVPNAFVVRMARAIDELSMEQTAADYSNAAGDGEGVNVGVPITEKLGDIHLRVWAELGRTQLPIGEALELPIGAVVDLDRTADSPVDLFINGLCFGHGNLHVTEDGEWAIEVLSLNKPVVRKPALVGGAGIVADQPDSTKGSI
ncbi:MAG TPA: FliM/FliN family flagellar motor switch protein [Solirubrobacteraceae bacterium]|nr:FliM/FliN family flagellar motor switch protein [Solirubrobacteraceae bacterium]